MRVVLWAAALMSSVCLAAEPAARPDAEAAPELRQWGAILDVGIPDGIGLSAAYRPWTFLRAHAGLTYNVAGFGVRAGATLIPFHFPISPTLTVDLGHYFPGDVTRIVHLVAPSSDLNGSAAALIQNVSYQYANAHLGLEFGAPDRFMVYLRGGLSYFQTSLTGLTAVLQESGATNVEAGDVSLRAIVPSAKLGFVLYF